MADSARIHPHTITRIYSASVPGCCIGAVLSPAQLEALLVAGGWLEMEARILTLEEVVSELQTRAIAARERVADLEGHNDSGNFSYDILQGRFAAMQIQLKDLKAAAMEWASMSRTDETQLRAAESKLIMLAKLEEPI